ncbi:MAG: hypothetical protein RIS36_1481 [Pseudomonadota bacterium]|jgi:hypothetical protein
MRPSLSILCAAIIVLLPVSGCVNRVVREALTLQPEALEQRRIQTRRFETTDEHELLTASLEVLQDLGFTVDETEPDLGLIVASKNREASSTGEMIGAFFIGAATDSEVTYNVEQRIRASVVTKGLGRSGTSVRVTFQRMVWNNLGEISANESLEEPKLYQEFFAKLSKSVLLTAFGI